MKKIPKTQNKGELIIPNHGVKYSELLEQFLIPFAKDLSDKKYQEDIIEFGIRAWNIGNMKTILPNAVNEKVLNMAKGEEEVNSELLLRMIDEKVYKFQEHTNFIVGFELKQTSGDPILSVVTQEQEAYLEKMYDDIEDKDAEEEHEENYINRNIIILKPLMPFLDWFYNLHPDDVDEIVEISTFLISMDIDDMEAWVKKKFDELFMSELEKYHDNKKEWPQNRNYKMFKQWFRVETSIMVYDLEKSPVFKY